MGLFLLRRFATLLLTLLCASGVVFVVLDVLPGNAAQVLLGPDAAPDAVAQLALQLGLDQPAWQRYGQWLVGLLRGDWGDSYAYGSPVSELIAERLWLTVPLALLAIADPLRETRQVGVVGAQGAATFTGVECNAWAGGVTGGIVTEG